MAYKDPNDPRKRQNNRKAKERYLSNNREKERCRQRIAGKAMYELLGEFLNYVRSTTPCKDCKTTYPPYVMEFDHVRGVKRYNIRSCLSWAALEVELAKCDIVCGNCHNIRTHERRQHAKVTGDSHDKN